MAKRTQSTAILVVGMHRSGTSAITRTLNLLGAALPSNLLAAKHDNPSGFWESADLMQIHEHFLAAVGSAWDDPLPLPDSAFHTPAATACRDEALAVLHHDFTNTPLFVIKDPRICRLLPLWRDILDAFGAEPVAVLPLRNPLETAMSLRVRDNLPREQALAQWLVHAAYGERGTRDWRRCFVNYDSCLADPAGQARRMAQKLGCFADDRLTEAETEIKHFWSEELRHHHLAPPNPGNNDIPAWIRRAYACFVQATCNDKADIASIDALVQEMTEASELYGPLIRGTTDLRQSVTAQADELRSLTNAAEQWRDEAQALDGKIGLLNKSLSEATTAGQHLVVENKRLNHTVRLSQQENSVLLRQIEQLSNDLEQAKATQRHFASERLELATNLANTKEELQLARTEYFRLADSRSEAHALIETLQKTLESSRRRQAELASVLEESDNKLGATLSDLELARASQAENARLQIEKTYLQTTLAETVQTLHAEHDAQREALTERLHGAETALTALANILTETLGEVTPSRRLGGLIRAAWRGRLRQRLREDADINLIARAGVFDATYYLRRYPDITATQADPLVHYVRCGATEGRDPSPLFDSRYYWSTYPDVARASANPLAHYVRIGAREGRRTHPARPGESPLPGLSPLLAIRLLGNQPPRTAPPIYSPPPPVAPFPPGAFGWLTEADHRTLADLLGYYDLTNRDTAPPDWNAESSAQRIKQKLGKLPSGPVTLSVIIPIHNQLRHTLACLESLALWPATQPTEILIGDDASSDDSEHLLATFKHLKVIRCNRAEGFLDNCNRTATHASGRYLLFLNNDTVVLPGALDNLLETFERHPDCGLAGCRLLYPDGRLQEAGGIVWADGSGWNFGRGDQPDKAEYSYLRDADYCSGAAIVVPTKVWRELGGFDKRYHPAYYEDTDLAFRVRETGLRVLYQPDAQVIHSEGISNGIAETAGEKRHQRENRPVFAKRWEARLATHGKPHQPPTYFAERTRRGRILVLDTTPPTPDRDSGSQDTLILLKLLRKQGWEVTFLPENLLDHPPYTAMLRREGIKCPHYPLVEDFMTAAAHFAAASDAIIVSRQPLARRVFGILKSAAPNAKLVFNTVDLHFLREEREAKLFGDAKSATRAADTRKAELAAIKSADATLVVSAYEADVLSRLAPVARVCVMPVRRDIPNGPFADFSHRNGVLFIGGFRHPPNQDAVRWLLSEIWPRVRAAGLRVPLYIVGADAPPFLQDDPTNDVHVVGHVPRLADAFASVRLSIAPIRYGAGLKGKVIDSLLHGVPVVATPVATEGAGLAHQRHLLEAESPEDLAASIVRLHEDAALWQTLATMGQEASHAMFSADTADRALRKLWITLGFSWCANETEGHRENTLTENPATIDRFLLQPLFSARNRQQFLAGRLSAKSLQAIEKFQNELLEGNPAREFTLDGFCACCKKTTAMGISRSEGTDTPNWRETLVCPACGMNNRQRLMATLLRQELETQTSANVYLMEQVSAFFRWSHRNLDGHNIVGSEYLPEETRSAFGEDIHHEDAQALSFGDATFDIVISNEVLEHVADPAQALRECARVLKPGGIFLATIPFHSAQDRSVTRAQVIDGSIKYHAPAQYHGNPLSPDGALVFTDFAWDFVDMASNAGFTDVSLEVYVSIPHVHLDLGNQVFRMTKKVPSTDHDYQ
jgi:GT2 family glycosyltransferase